MSLGGPQRQPYLSSTTSSRADTTAIAWFLEKPSFSKSETKRAASKLGIEVGMDSALGSDCGGVVENRTILNGFGL